MVNRSVLVLNQNYEPLNICRARRAVVLVYEGKAEMLEDGTGFIHSISYSFPLPSVIRLPYMIKRPRPKRRLTRLEVFSRDQYTCQYCGKESRLLTLDHIIPRYKLIRRPHPPHDNIPFYIPLPLKTQIQWQKYLPC